MPTFDLRPHVLRRRLALVGMGAVLAAAVVLTVPAEAHATPQQDAAFILTLDHYSIPYASETAAINAGHSICEAFDAGASFRDMVSAGMRAGFTGPQIAHEIGASIGAYCPEHEGLLGSPSSVYVA